MNLTIVLTIGAIVLASCALVNQLTRDFFETEVVSSDPHSRTYRQKYPERDADFLRFCIPNFTKTILFGTCFVAGILAFFFVMDSVGLSTNVFVSSFALVCTAGLYTLYIATTVGSAYLFSLSVTARKRESETPV